MFLAGLFEPIFITRAEAFGVRLAQGLAAASQLFVKARELVVIAAAEVADEEVHAQVHPLFWGKAAVKALRRQFRNRLARGREAVYP